MSLILIVLGIVLIVFVFVDALWTTLWVDGGGGPLSSRMTRGIWRAAHRIVPPGHDRVLSLSGPVLLVITVLTWTTLLWIGWVVLFSADPRSILNTHNHTPPDLIGRIYFVGYTVFTLGNGDYMPQGWWRIVTDLAVASGFFLITLTVSYFLSVISAVTAMRTLASQITALGNRAEAFVLTEWDGRGFPTLASHLNAISTQLGSVTEQHLSYPLLHYFHTTNLNKATSIAVTILDDALTVLEDGVDPVNRPPQSALRPARSAISNYLDTLISAAIQPADHAPPPPDLSRLRDSGVPVVDDAQFADAIKQRDERRRRLLAMVRDDGYQWPE